MVVIISNPLLYSINTDFAHNLVNNLGSNVKKHFSRLRNSLKLNNLNNIKTNTLGKTFLIRGGEHQKNNSSKTEIITQEEYLTEEQYYRDYADEINLDEQENINRLNRAYKPKKVLTKAKGRSLKDEISIEKPADSKPSNNHPDIQKPGISEQEVAKPTITEVPSVDKVIENKPIIDNKGINDEQINYMPKDSNDESKPIENNKYINKIKSNKIDKIKEKYRRENEDQFKEHLFKRNKKKSTISIPKRPASFTNKEIFNNFVLKNKIAVEIISYSFAFIILYFYLRAFKREIKSNYRTLYRRYKNKDYNNCIAPAAMLSLYLFVIFKILYSGPNLIKVAFLKFAYYIYVFILFLKGNKFLINEISKVIANTVYPFVCVNRFLNYIYLNLLEFLFKYTYRLGQISTEFLIRFLLDTQVGQRINNPFISKILVRSRRYFFKDPFEAVGCDVIESAFKTFFEHKNEIIGLFKVYRILEEYKNYCVSNNKKDAILDYLINNKSNVKLITSLKYKPEEDNCIKLNKLLCAIYNINKNDYEKLRFTVFRNYKNFKPNTFLSKLFNDVYKFGFDNERVRQKAFESAKKSIDEGLIPEWTYSYIARAYIYGLDTLVLRKLFSIEIPDYIVNDKNFCRYLTYRGIIYNIFYKNFYKFILGTTCIGLIFSSFIFLSYFKPKVLIDMKLYFLKKIENIRKGIDAFFEEVPARYIALSIGSLFLSFGYLYIALNLFAS